MTYRYIIGIDASLASTGIVVVDISSGDAVVIYEDTIRTKSDEIMIVRQTDILIEIVRIVNELGLHRGDVTVALEDYGSSKIRGKLYERVELVGMIKLTLAGIHSMDFHMISPKSLKMFMGGGNFKKNQMKASAIASFGFKGRNEHTVDAYCLCRYLLAHFLGMDLTIRYQYPIHYAIMHLQPYAKPIQKKLRIVPLTSAKPRHTLSKRIARKRS